MLVHSTPSRGREKYEKPFAKVVANLFAHLYYTPQSLWFIVRFVNKQ